MNSLSLQAINESSSYEVTEVGEGCYQFFTDHGVHCFGLPCGHEDGA